MITNENTVLDRVEESYRRTSIHTFKDGHEEPLVGEPHDPPIYDNDETHMSPIYEMDDEMENTEDESASGYMSVPSPRTSTTALSATTALSGNLPASTTKPAVTETVPEIYDNVDQSIYEMDDVM